MKRDTVLLAVVAALIVAVIVVIAYGLTVRDEKPATSIWLDGNRICVSEVDAWGRITDRTVCK